MDDEIKKYIDDRLTAFTYAAVKVAGDWELDVLAVPFKGLDSDKQYFDAGTDVMPDTFTTPLIAYQHGVKQGATGFEDKPVKLGSVVQGSLTKQIDGWHVRVILDKAVEKARQVWEAAKRGMVAVSSDSISHYARLEIGGKLHMYSKDTPGRIAVWPLAGVSLWDTGNGNLNASSRVAYAMPVMKAIYREAGIRFPEIKDTTGVSPEAEKAKKRAEIVKRAKEILAQKPHV